MKLTGVRWCHVCLVLLLRSHRRIHTRQLKRWYIRDWTGTFYVSDCFLVIVYDLLALGEETWSKVEITQTHVWRHQIVEEIS